MNDVNHFYQILLFGYLAKGIILSIKYTVLKFQKWKNKVNNNSSYNIILL